MRNKRNIFYAAVLKQYAKRGLTLACVLCQVRARALRESVALSRKCGEANRRSVSVDAQHAHDAALRLSSVANRLTEARQTARGLVRAIREPTCLGLEGTCFGRSVAKSGLAR